MINEKEWQARDDLATLKRADEIKKSRTRMNAAKSQARKEMAALKNVSQSTRTRRKIK